MCITCFFLYALLFAIMTLQLELQSSKHDWALRTAAVTAAVTRPLAYYDRGYSSSSGSAYDYTTSLVLCSLLL
jgi:hypothetical protein